MFRNYLTIAIRHFWANKQYVITNVVGLAVAITVCIMAYYHLAYNYQFNEMYKESTKNIYRIDTYGIIDGAKHEAAGVPHALANALMAETPEIKQRIRYIFGDLGTSRLKVGDKYYKDYINYTDSGFFKVFKHEFIYGNETALSDKSGIVLSDVDYKKYFGNKNPLGQVISLVYKGGKRDFIVRGVVKQPQNSMFTFDAIARIENFIIESKIDESDWKYWNRPEVYLEIPDEKNVAVVKKQLAKYVKTYNDFNKSISKLDEFRLISFEEAGDNSADIWYRSTNSKWNPSFMIMLCSIALLILFIACFNYTNSSIALSGTRIKEISLRKVMGSQRKHLIFQFLLEHFVISLMAVLLSLAFAEIITPIYVGLYSNPEYGIWDFSSYDYIVPFLGFILIFTTIISGAYPAFYISKLKTADALRRNLKLKGGNRFTYALLTLQMTITVIGIGMGIVFTENISYIDKVDKGYAIENIISLPMDALGGQKDYDLFKSKIKENPDILQIAGSSQHISWWSWIEKTKCKDAEYEAIMLPTGDNYLQTMGVKLKQGRFFDINISDDTNRVIINEKYMKTASLTDPLNESVTFYGRPFKIIGVVGDFMQRGVQQKIKPMVITFERKNGVMVVQTSADKVKKVNEYLEAKWLETFDQPYDGFPQLKMLDNDKWIYRLMKNIFMYISGISLLLSLIGIFVLISLIINKKTKEIGIRKIMGAPLPNIIFILGKNYIYIFGIATLVGSLAGLVITQFILEKIFIIENHIEITPFPFLLSAFTISILAAITIGFKVYKAANQNPVISLRTE